MSTAALKIYDPKTRKTTTENVRMGEDIYNMTFLEIIGKDEGVVLLFGDQRIEILKGDDPK